MFELQEEKFKTNFFKKGTFQHNTGKGIELFPFVTNDKEIKNLHKDLLYFRGITGACYRQCLQYSEEHTIDNASFIKNICDKVRASGNKNLEDILKHVIFDDSNQLVVFNSAVFPHLQFDNNNSTLKSISKYIHHIFFDGELRNQLKNIATVEPDNILYKLVLAELPTPPLGKVSKTRYYLGCENTRILFKKDLSTLLQVPHLFVNNFHLLLKFYFFKYVGDLSMKLNQFFDEPRRNELFFSLDWERLQASRLAFTHGWKSVLSTDIANIFSHANTLELLNHLNWNTEDNTPLTYEEIAGIHDRLTDEEKNALCDSIKNLIDKYKEQWNKENWEMHEKNVEIKYPKPVFQEIYRLWFLVEAQFKNSKRHRAYEGYAEWFKQFCVFNFLKKRGRNGYSLSLDQETLLFLTQLSIGQEKKIKLSKLWEEFHIRGINFDEISKEQIVELFEKINLIETKSDSGDAVYVKIL